MHFQQDNASAHVTDNVIEYFEQKEMHLMHWPPRSPDLSLIENVWVKMEQEIAVFRPETEEELKHAIESVITKMNAEEPQVHYFENLYHSKRKRVQEVLASEGAPINHKIDVNKPKLCKFRHIMNFLDSC